jgi:hypothetical protein
MQKIIIVLLIGILFSGAHAMNSPELQTLKNLEQYILKISSAVESNDFFGLQENLLDARYIADNLGINFVSSKPLISALLCDGVSTQLTNASLALSNLSVIHKEELRQVQLLHLMDTLGKAHGILQSINIVKDFDQCTKGI